MAYRIWQSPDSVLIQTDGGSIEVSREDALGLGQELVELLASPKPASISHGTKWTPADDAKLRQLVSDGLKGSALARELGRTVEAVKFRRGVLHLNTGSPEQVARMRAVIAKVRAKRHVA